MGNSLKQHSRYDHEYTQMSLVKHCTLVYYVIVTFLHLSNSLTVMLPVPGPTSSTTSVGERAAYGM